MLLILGSDPTWTTHAIRGPLDHEHNISCLVALDHCRICRNVTHYLQFPWLSKQSVIFISSQKQNAPIPTCNSLVSPYAVGSVYVLRVVKLLLCAYYYYYYFIYLNSLLLLLLHHIFKQPITITITVTGNIWGVYYYYYFSKH